MARDLGSKFTCYNCGTRFYDLHKPEPVCPKCDTDQREGSARASPAAERRRPRLVEAAAPEPEEAEKDLPAEEIEEAEPDIEDEDEDLEDDDED